MGNLKVLHRYYKVILKVFNKLTEQSIGAFYGTHELKLSDNRYYLIGRPEDIENRCGAYTEGIYWFIDIDDVVNFMDRTKKLLMEDVETLIS